MGTLKSLAGCICLLFVGAGVPAELNPSAAAQELEKALKITPDTNRGREIYLVCAVCHQPEGWGSADGEYPQIAGQLYGVIIKQMADIRARNRDTPTMFPFTKIELLGLQQIADVAGYLSQLPMNPNNSVGPGTDLAKGEKLYSEYCADCHGEQGEGIAEEYMPLIQGQHYPYLMRQFEWIANGKRRNSDPEMVEQIKDFSPEDIAAIMDYTSRLSPAPQRLAAPDWKNPDFDEFVRMRPLESSKTSSM